MPATSVRGGQILNGTIQRADMNVTTIGQAVVTKIIQGSGVSLSSTGADSGTGDVTVSGVSAVSTDAGNQSKLGSDNLIYTPGGVNGFVSKTAAYTLTLADRNKYFICSGGSWTLTLPAASAGLSYNVRNDMGISGTTGTITLTPPSGTINGLASIALLPQQECVLVCDGTNWRTLGLNREVVLGTQDITSATASGTILLPVGYRYFELQITSFIPVTNDDSLNCQFSTNGGSTWIATGYYYGILFNPSSTTAGFTDAENLTNISIIPNSYGGVTGPGSQAKIVIWPGNATQWPVLEGDSGSRRSTSVQVKWQIYGLLASAGVINAFKYFVNSGGNIANSFLTVKGVV